MKDGFLRNEGRAAGGRGGVEVEEGKEGGRGGAGWLAGSLVGWRGKETGGGGCQVARLSRSQNCQKVN